MLRFLSACVVLSFIASGCASEAGPFDMAPYAALEAEPAPEGFDGVTATFLGVSTLVIRDGETTLLIDGFFSRPDLSGMGMLREITPDAERIDAGLAFGNVAEAAAITTVHSHFDHAMDVAVVALRTGAIVAGSPSTANIARGGGVPENQIVEVAVGDSAQFGAFTMRWFASRHYPLPEPIGSLISGPIEAPLEVPARATAWKQGRADTIVIEHPRGTLLVQGSAGYLDGALAGTDVDVAFLGIGGLGSEAADYVDGYWNALVGETSPSRIFPMHWDDFSKPLDEPLRPGGDGADFVSAMASVQEKASAAGIAVALPPFAVPVALY